jgi:hypothetical protein
MVTATITGVITMVTVSMVTTFLHILATMMVV